MKNKVQEKQPTNIPDLYEIFTDLCVRMNVDYLIKLAESMPNRLQNVMKVNIDCIFTRE